MKKIKLLVLFFPFLFFLHSFPASAAMSDGMSFFASPLYPDNQQKGVVGYFDLSVSPNKEQTLQMYVKNKTNHEITVNMKSANAFTSVNGGISYLSGDGNGDVKITNSSYKFSPFIDVDSSVTIKANTEVKVPVHIKIPKDAVGTYLGGILLTDNNNVVPETKKNASGSSFIINNKFAEALPIEINLPNKISPSFSFGEPGIEVTPSGLQFYIDMINSGAAILDDTQGTYSVYDENGKFLFDGQFGSFKMAPMTETHYMTFWKNPTILPGTYKVHLERKTENGMENADRTFTIGDQEIKTYANETHTTPVPVSNSISWWVWVLFIACGIFLLLLGIFLGRRKKKKEDKKNNQK